MALALSVISVVASLTAVGLSIYLNVYRERRLRPRLQLLLDPESSSNLVTLEYPAEGECAEHWLRFSVCNERDRRTAEDVEVMFIGCKSEDGNNPELPLESRHLRWSATSEAKPGIDAMAAGGPKPMVSATIPPGFYRYLDLLHASNRGKVDAAVRCVPRICVWPPPSDRNHLLSGSYVFYFAVTARDANASFYRLQVSFDGEWSPLREQWWSNHLQVSAPAALAIGEVPAGF